MEPNKRAISERDLAYARLRGFQERVKRAKAVIREALKIGPIGVSFSGGKDSTVTLHLVRSAAGEDTPAAFFDSGADLASTHALVDHYGVMRIHPRLTYQEIARYTGKWGYANPVDPGCPFDIGMVLIHEPAETFVVRAGLRVVALGLRAHESAGRRFNADVRGELYCNADRTWHCCPLARWSVDDVWAYIAAYGLRYNEAYDVLTRLGVPREDQRVDMLLSERSAQYGKFAHLRAIDPTLFNQLAAEFPGIRAYA